MMMPPRSRVVAAALFGVGLGACATPPSSAPAPSAQSASPAPVGPEVPALHPSVDDYPETRVTLTPAGDEPVTIPVKVADTGERRAHGLMEVRQLPDGTGMLFTYESETTGSYFMKDTLVPLDIAFVASDDTVLETFAMDPCESEPCPTYGPDEPYRAALEVPQGWLAEHGVDTGTTVTVDEVHPAD